MFTLAAGVGAEHLLIQRDDGPAGLAKAAELFNVIDDTGGFIPADFLTAEDPPVVNVHVAQAPNVNVEKSRVLGNQMDLMATMANGLEGRYMGRHSMGGSRTPNMG